MLKLVRIELNCHLFKPRMCVLVNRKQLKDIETKESIVDVQLEYKAGVTFELDLNASIKKRA